MSNRRRFLSQSFYLSIFASLGAQGCAKDTKDTTKNNPHSVDGFPVALATWDNTEAVQAASEVLAKKGRALDAVEAGARVPEADPTDMSVGYGGHPDRDGIVTLDACIMDEKGNAGSVTYIRDIMHPVSVARKVMELTPHVILSGEGARRFAIEQGFPVENLLTPQAEAAWKKWLEKGQYKPQANIERHDTIGIVALDAAGDLSGACTTSGMAYKMHGRVGDSPIIGAGMYVDNAIGAACATGLGELVLKTLSSFLIVELMRQGRSPQEACEEAVNRIVEKNPNARSEGLQVGLLALHKSGAHGAYSVLPGFNYCIYQNGKMEVFEADSALK